MQFPQISVGIGVVKCMCLAPRANYSSLLATTRRMAINGYSPSMNVTTEAGCPGCGHTLTIHHGRHCDACEETGDECPAVDPGSESEGG